jgi:hypothetical protein
VCKLSDLSGLYFSFALFDVLNPTCIAFPAGITRLKTIGHNDQLDIAAILTSYFPIWLLSCGHLRAAI